MSVCVCACACVPATLGWCADTVEGEADRQWQCLFIERAHEMQTHHKDSCDITQQGCMVGGGIAEVWAEDSESFDEKKKKARGSDYDHLSLNFIFVIPFVALLSLSL